MYNLYNDLPKHNVQPSNFLFYIKRVFIEYLSLYDK